MAPPPAGSEVFVTETIVRKGVLTGYDDKGRAKVKVSKGRGAPKRVDLSAVSTEHPQKACEAPASGRGRLWLLSAIVVGLVGGVAGAIGKQVWQALWPYLSPLLQLLGVN